MSLSRRGKRLHACAAASFACLIALLSSSAPALVLDSDDGLATTTPPIDDPGWAHVGRRLGGPTVIYLGRGWVLTAKHVGAGILVFDDGQYDPKKDSVHQLYHENGEPSDLILFEIAGNPELPALPVLPLATRTPLPGQDVTMIGTGRPRGHPITWHDPLNNLIDGWTWDAGNEKRWGTNVTVSRAVDLEHSELRTRVFATLFNRLDDPGATDHEAQASSGDSGGAIFARRDPTDPASEWALAGVMITVSGVEGRPPASSFYGDFTYAADVGYYRDQIVPLVRPACSNDVDDDRDGRRDYPDDPDCASPDGESELGPGQRRWVEVAAALGTIAVLAIALRVHLWRRRRARPSPFTRE